MAMEQIACFEISSSGGVREGGVNCAGLIQEVAEQMRNTDATRPSLTGHAPPRMSRTGRIDSTRPEKKAEEQIQFCLIDHPICEPAKHHPTSGQD